jgi:hypothetical protein
MQTATNRRPQKKKKQQALKKQFMRHTRKMFLLSNKANVY